MLKKSVCGICQGRKHVVKDGVLQRCECLINQIIEETLIKSGVTKPYNEINLNYLEQYPARKQNNVDVVEKCMERLASGELPVIKNVISPIMCLSGAEDGIRDLLVANILKAAVIGGFEVHNTSLKELISRCFADEQLVIENEVSNYSVFSVYFGTEITLSVATNMIKDLVRLKNNSNLFLMFSTSLKKGEISQRYGFEVGKYFDNPRFFYLETEN